MEEATFKKISNRQLLELVNDILHQKKIAIVYENDNSSLTLNNLLKDFGFITSLSSNNSDFNLVNINVSTSFNLTRYDKIVKNIRLKILESISFLNRLQIKYNDLTLNEMFLLTGSPYYYDIYDELLLPENLNLNHLPLHEIYNLINSLNVNHSEQYFLKNKRFSKQKVLSLVKDYLDINEIDKCVNKISALLNNTYSLVPPIHYNEYTQAFIDNNILNKNCTDIELLEEAEVINSSKNHDILSSIVNVNFLTKLNFKRHKLIKAENTDKINKYLSLRDEIYKEYKDNLENINIYLNSFSFLNKFLNTESYEKLRDYALDEEAFSNYLELIKKELILYKEISYIEHKLKSFSDAELELLEISYNITKNTDNISKSLEELPYIITYKEINDILTKNKSKKINSNNKDICKLIHLINSLQSSGLEYLNNNFKNLKDQHLAIQEVYSIKIIKESSLVNTSDFDKVYYSKDLISKCNHKINDLNNLKYKEYNKLDIEKEILILLKASKIKYKRNFCFKEHNLELIAYKDSIKDKFIYFIYDTNIPYDEIDIDKLLLIDENNIPIIHISTESMWNNKSQTLNKLKDLINLYLN